MSDAERTSPERDEPVGAVPEAPPGDDYPQVVHDGWFQAEEGTLQPLSVGPNRSGDTDIVCRLRRPWRERLNRRVLMLLAAPGTMLIITVAVALGTRGGPPAQAVPPPTPLRVAASLPAPPAVPVDPIAPTAPIAAPPVAAPAATPPAAEVQRPARKAAKAKSKARTKQASARRASARQPSPTPRRAR